MENLDTQVVEEVVESGMDAKYIVVGALTVGAVALATTYGVKAYKKRKAAKEYAADYEVMDEEAVYEE